MKSIEGTYDTASAKEADLNKIVSILNDLGAEKIYVKCLASNDNSKNQPYFGAHLTDLPFIPTGELVASESTSKKKAVTKRSIKFQSSVNLSWVDVEGQIYPAPKAKLIYYPQYPEVRFSGFLAGSKVKVSEWMNPYKRGRSKGRWLILGVCAGGHIYAYLVTPECALSEELTHTELIHISSIFSQVNVDNFDAELSTRDTLLRKLLTIHQMGWIPSQKLNADLTSTPYRAPNGGGYTLEALLGIPPNGIAEPDYLGWEVKQFGCTRFPRVGAKPTTLFTPEPNGGIYKSQGVIEFVRKYGYADKSGKPDRKNFGGRHVFGKFHPLTGLTLSLSGFDSKCGAITNSGGAIALIDHSDNIAASWSFAKLMDHWKRKHSQAVYVPCLRRKGASLGEVKYSYGSTVELGMITNFELILTAINSGSVYYDPGIKVEQFSSAKPKAKRRSQFRVNHKHLDGLYRSFEVVDVIADPLISSS